MKNLSQDRQFSGQDLKPLPPLTVPVVLYTRTFEINCDAYRSKFSYRASDL
jgi:hypothetical protein